MADKEKHPPTNDQMDASKPKKKKSAKDKSAKKSADRKGKGNKGAAREARRAGEASGAAVQASNASDADAKARERIAAAASAAASQLQPSGVSALLGDDIDRLIEPPPPNLASLDGPEDDSASVGPTAATDLSAMGTPDSDPQPGAAPPGGNDTRSAIAASPPDRAPDRDSSVEQTAVPTVLASKSRFSRWSTAVILLLLAVAGFFYVRAILPIQTAHDRQSPGISTETPVDSTASPGRSTPESLPAPEKPDIDPSLVETLARHLSPPETISNPAGPELKPLPAGQLELIKRVFAPEQEGTGSPPLADDTKNTAEASSR